MALAVAEQQTAAFNTTASSTLTLAAGSAVGDLLVLVQANDFYTLATLLTPTGTAASAWTARTTFDGGSNLPHVKVWTAPVTTAGAQTVIANYTNADEEKGIALWRIPGAIFSISAHLSGVASASHVAPTLANTSVDAIRMCFWTANDAGTGEYNYTLPGAPFVGAPERDLAGFSTYGAGYEPITSGAATGTKTATASVATHPSLGTSVLAVASGAAPAAPASPWPSRSDRPVKRLRFR